MKMPNGGMPAIARHARAPGDQPSMGWIAVKPRISAIFWVPLTWATWPTVKKIADFVRLCMVICRQARKIRERPAHAEGKDDDAHMLDRGIGEQPFDVPPAVEHEGREHQRDQADRDHQRAGRDGLVLSAISILNRRIA